MEEILPGFDIIPTATIAWFLSELPRHAKNAFLVVLETRVSALCGLYRDGSSLGCFVECDLLRTILSGNVRNALGINMNAQTVLTVPRRVVQSMVDGSCTCLTPACDSGGDFPLSLW